MTSDLESGWRPRVLRRVGPRGSALPRPLVSQSLANFTEGQWPYGLDVPVASDMEELQQALERIRSCPFVADANEPQFAATQHWIEECGRDVKLPLNFCGGLLITRLYRLIAPASEQTPSWMAAVYEAAAAYDFAFLSLAHADDEADMTFVRDGKATRFVTHPQTRAVDGINLLLSGATAMQETLNSWPRHAGQEAEVASARHPLAVEVMEALMRALREAAFPILLDRAGLGHTCSANPKSSGLAPILIDAQSLHRVEAFTRHRAHTYFMRATDLATLLAGYTIVEPDLSAALDELFSFWGILGAATDDIQDLFVDFASGVHSVCTVMAHLCVAADAELRPTFRRHLSEELVQDQRSRLAGFFGIAHPKLDRTALLAFLTEIELCRALSEHLNSQGALFAIAIHKAAFHFGFSAKLMIEIVSVVCRDPSFSVPEDYLSALETVADEVTLNIMSVRAGKFITSYFVGRFWPKDW